MSPFAGTFVDRFSRRTVMIVTDVQHGAVIALVISACTRRGRSVDRVCRDGAAAYDRGIL